MKSKRTILNKIPKGYYCYKILEIVDGYKLKTAVCPYWGVNPFKRDQDNGYCIYTGLKDWEDDTLLWDQVKECEINKPEE